MSRAADTNDGGDEPPEQVRVHHERERGNEHELSDYEKLRLERIRKNEEKLRQLGLLDFGQQMRRRQTAKRKTQHPRKKKASTKGQERRSPRLREQSQSRSPSTAAETEEGLTQEYFMEEAKQMTSRQQPRSFRRRATTVRYTDLRLSDEDRRSLEGSVDDNYLDKFREFLQCHDKISEQNLRNVMRQVTKLARGQGIRYDSKQYGWPAGCYFCQGVRITTLSDIVELMRQAQHCEDRWGRDHGNGWLLSHPLKKLLLFQQFVLNHPSFLHANCRIDEYEYSENNNNNNNNNNHQVDDHDSNANNSNDVVSNKPARHYVGARVAKEFDGVAYYGTIDRYTPKTKFWHVAYDDNDREEYDAHDLASALRYYEQVQSQDDHHKKRRRPATQQQPSAAPPSKMARTVTP